MNETAMSVVTQLPNTKDQIEIFAHQLEQGLTDGRIVASELLRFQKAMERVFDKVKPTLIDCALQELEKYEKNTVIKNTEFSVVEAGTKYDYSKCNDVIYNDLSIALDYAKEKVKDRETFLKSLKNPMTVVDENSGEMVEIYPPSKSSTTTVKVTFK